MDIMVSFLIIEPAITVMQRDSNAPSILSFPVPYKNSPKAGTAWRLPAISIHL